MPAVLSMRPHMCREVSSNETRTFLGYIIEVHRVNHLVAAIC